MSTTKKYVRNQSRPCPLRRNMSAIKVAHVHYEEICQKAKSPMSTIKKYVRNQSHPYPLRRNMSEIKATHVHYEEICQKLVTHVHYEEICQKSKSHMSTTKKYVRNLTHPFPPRRNICQKSVINLMVRFYLFCFLICICSTMLSCSIPNEVMQFKQDTIPCLFQTSDEVTKTHTATCIFTFAAHSCKKTQTANSVFVPKVGTNTGIRAFSVAAPIPRNSLSLSVRSVENNFAI